jgi:cytochrome c biogenesis protein CcmG, thiol:disulfide interchange protein DsbE
LAETAAGQLERTARSVEPAERPDERPAWRRRPWLLLAVSLTILALLGLLLYGLRENPGTEIGGAVPLSGPAPDFAVTTLDGTPLKLSDLRGQFVVINVWASWCVPCRQESAELNRAYARYQGRGVTFVGIAWNDLESDARKFVQEYRVPYPVALDQAGRVSIDYGITGVPETFVVDREGRFAQKWVGPINAAQLAGLVDPLLR